MAPETSTPALSPTDRALLQAIRVWGDADPETLWDGFPAERRASLRSAWNAGAVGEVPEALESLRDGHAAQARPDLGRVHPSWWVRALEDEPLSVRATVLSQLPETSRATLLETLGLDPVEAAADRPPNPLAVRAVAALWSERLVGDVPRRDDDPPAIVALTAFDAPTAARFLQTAGLAKWSLTGSTPPDLAQRDRDRAAELASRLRDVDPGFRLVAAADVAALQPGGTRPEVRLGLTTFARLLAVADPHRTRWALQHLPYPLARAIRHLIGPDRGKAPRTSRWELDVLQAAWGLLHQEGRIAGPWRWGPLP